MRKISEEDDPSCSMQVKSRNSSQFYNYKNLDRILFDNHVLPANDSLRVSDGYDGGFHNMVLPSR